MSSQTTPQSLDMPLAHAGLALGLLVATVFLGGTLIPKLLLWPFYLLAPLGLYVLIARAVPSLRQSLTWARVGRLDRRARLAAALVVFLSCVALILFHELADPDMSRLVGAIPKWPLPLLLVGGVVFSCVNALLEEVLFRGLLFDALWTSYGNVGTLFIQAGVFGVVHVYGFPSGVFGVILATIYGLMQGGLRLFTGGLAACWFAHILADATIFTLIISHL